MECCIQVCNYCNEYQKSRRHLSTAFLAEEGGSDLHFLPCGKRRKDSLRQAVASNSPPDCCDCILRIPHHSKIKNPPTDVVGFLMAEDEGFEPPRTESESGVLPLH